jgi:hypothetical protein
MVEGDLASISNIMKIIIDNPDILSADIVKSIVSIACILLLT